MAWTEPKYPRTQVDAAGGCLTSRTRATIDQKNDALDVINNWRSSHSYPLQVLKMALLQRAKKVDQKAIVAQRIKRMSSIVLKLKRNENMKLSQMQDLGGCRAVLHSMRAVTRLVALHERSTSRNPYVRPELLRKYDYIANPKPDGYRSIHLVYKYRTASAARSVFNGLRIEMQIRSRLQHAWATAVETASTFTGQALKSNMGEWAWKRFFALMGSAIALRERCPLVPGTPQSPDELREELRKLASDLRIEAVLESWKVVVDVLGKKSDVEAYLLSLNSLTRKITVKAYRKYEVPAAMDDYLAVERDNVEKPEVQAVLVSVTSLQALKIAYPNYYLDTSAFLDAFRRAIA